MNTEIASSKEAKEEEQHADALVQIDRLRLDRECIRLPGDYLFYAKAAADARATVDERKIELDVVEAELASKIRKTPAKYGLEKCTEAGIAGLIPLQEEYRVAQKRLNKAKHRLEMNQAVVQALEMKKRSLTLLVDLYSMEYFSDVNVSQKGREAVEEMTKRSVRRRSQPED